MAFCQTNPVASIQGKLVFDNADLESIYIYNLNKSQSTLTQVNGYFVLNCSVQDTLLVSSLQFEKKNIKRTLIEKKCLFL
jgi:hypothetical protein